jgi:hypothetical protein
MGIGDTVKQMFTRPKSFEELEETEERREIELSIAQKESLIKQLKAKGGEPNDFKEKKGGFSWSGIIKWLKTH